jgi:hypothetical protein
LESKSKEQVALENKNKQNNESDKSDKGFFDVPNKKREFDEKDLDENSYRSTEEVNNKQEKFDKEEKHEENTSTKKILDNSINKSKPLGEDMNGKFVLIENKFFI